MADNVYTPVITLAECFFDGIITVISILVCPSELEAGIGALHFEVWLL